MKKGNWLIPALFALLIGSLLIISIPIDFEKYRLDERLMHYSASQETFSFADVDGDGKDDCIDCGGQTHHGQRRNACTATGLRERYQSIIIDQFNVKELIYGERQIISSNYDGDDYDEILIPSAEGNKLYMHVFEGPHFKEPVLKILLDSIVLEHGKPSLILQKFGEQDVNGDGFGEVFFFLGTGFPHYPRRVYRLDLANAELIASPLSSVGFSPLNYPYQDLKAFTGMCLNPGNYMDNLNLPYPDTAGYAWAMDFNLKFLFEPEPVVAYPGGVYNGILNGYLFTLWFSGSPTGKTYLEKRSLNSGVVLEKQVFDLPAASMAVVDNILVIVTQGILLCVNGDMEIIEERKHDSYSRENEWMDLNMDGKKELLSKSRTLEVLTIFSSEFDYPVHLSNSAERDFRLMSRQIEPHEVELVVKRDNNLEFYSYHQNPFYWLRWPYYLLIFGISSLASTVLFKRFQQNIERKYEQERQMSRLQLLSIKNQVDPHFTLNALNSIDWMYRNNETKKASSFMGKLSRMMNQTVLNSDKISTTLWDELDFCRNYCQLEKLRDKKFYFEIEVEETLDPFEIELPKQLVFTYVENAIKHGLRPKTGEKHLWVKVRKLHNGIEIVVKDDGVGFSEKSETSGTGVGLKIVGDMVELWQRLKREKIQVQFKEQSEVMVTITIVSPIFYK